MKIDVDENGYLRLTEVFSGVLLETEEGHQIGVCMRDDTFEINVMPDKKHTDNWWRIDMQKGVIERMVGEWTGPTENTEGSVNENH